MMAKHAPDTERRQGSDGSTSCMSECARLEDDESVADGLAAELRRRGMTGGFSSLADRPPESTSEIVSPARAAALWRTLEDAGITLTAERPRTDVGMDTSTKAD